MLTRQPVWSGPVLPAAGAAEQDSGARNSPHGSSPGGLRFDGRRGRDFLLLFVSEAADWPTPALRHFPFRPRCLSLVGVNFSGGPEVWSFAGFQAGSGKTLLSGRGDSGEPD